MQAGVSRLALESVWLHDKAARTPHQGTHHYPVPEKETGVDELVYI